jgi:hypothetical protein
MVVALLNGSAQWQWQCMDKLQLAGQNLGRVFIFRSAHWHATTFLVLSVKLPNLQLKTRPKQLLGSLLFVIALPGVVAKSTRSDKLIKPQMPILQAIQKSVMKL